MALLMCVALAILGRSASGESPSGTCRLSPDVLAFNTTNFFLNRRPLEDPEAKCNDGSQAQIYYRPCCNGDTAGDFCNESLATWFISFGDGNQDGWCWDEASCAARAAVSPNLSSSKSLPDLFNRSGDQFDIAIGAFSKFAEANPNFYKAYAVYVPYCSSDLFLGGCEHDSPAFCGRSIARAALRSLLPDMRRYGADEVVLAGGAGIMNLLPELKAELSGVASKVVAICDGCAILDAAGPDKPCPNAWACAPRATLPAGVEFWGAELSDSCGGWRCLLAGPGGSLERAAAELPLLARQPLYDRLALASRGDPTGVNTSLAEDLRSELTSALSPADVKLGVACHGPQSGFTNGAFLGEKGPYGGQLSFGAGGLMAKGLYTLLRRGGTDSNIDSCKGQGCNPSCESQRGNAAWIL